MCKLRKLSTCLALEFDRLASIVDTISDSSWWSLGIGRGKLGQHHDVLGEEGGRVRREYQQKFLGRWHMIVYNYSSTCTIVWVKQSSRRRWKELPLISKDKDFPATPSAYSPLCMLDNSWKLLTGMLKPRFESCIDDVKDLPNKKYGERTTPINVQSEIVE